MGAGFIGVIGDRVVADGCVVEIGDGSVDTVLDSLFFIFIDCCYVTITDFVNCLRQWI